MSALAPPAAATETTGPESASPQPHTPPALRTPLVRCGDFLFRFRDGVFPLVVVAFLAILPPWLPWWLGGGAPADLLPADRALDVVGIAIACSGLLLRMIVIATRYVKRGGKARKVYAENLVTTGVFAYCRNPLYVGNLLLMLGYVVIHNHPALYLTVVPFFVFAYVAIVAAEERFLAAEFGDAYARCCSDVPRWLFQPHKLVGTLRTHRISWRQVVAKEYPGVGQMLLVITALLAWERFRIPVYGWSGSDLLAVTLPAGAAIGALVLLVRVLKKRGFFVGDPV